MASGTAKPLESHPLLGSAKLRQTLSKTRKVNTLINAVKKFQDENGIKMDTLPPALQLLDLHKIKRGDLYEQAAMDISERVVARIRALGENGSPDSIKKLEDQLEKCFDLFPLPQFREIVLENLKQLPKIPENYLDTIMNDRAFYDACPLTVQQQIWLRKNDLFVEAFSPLIESYLKRKQDLLLSVEPSNTNFFTFETTKARRQWQEIKDLIKYCGNHEELFKSMTTYIRELFASTGDTMLCSLRYELIMAAHDAGIETLVKSDPCHDFAWCLEACMRDKHLESHQITRLRHMLDTFQKSSYESVVDMAMIAGDVHVIHFFCSLTVKKLRDSGGAHLPRDMPSVVIMVRVLSFGCAAKDLVTKKVQPTEVFDTVFVNRFLAEFQTLMVEDCTRAEMMRKKKDAEEELDLSNLLTKPSDQLITFLKASRLAALLWYHCCLDMLPSKKRIGDLRGLARYMEVLPLLRDNIVCSGVWCHLIFHRLLHSNQYEAALADPVIYSAVIEQLLLKNLLVDRCVKYQLFKLISQIGFIWGQPHCMTLMRDFDFFKSANHPDMEYFIEEYNKLRERIFPKQFEGVMEGPMDQETAARLASVPQVPTPTGAVPPPPPVPQYAVFGPNPHHPL
ncbi:cofactor of BRCA1 [Oesophagostomum dentatum]|uniref:Cofactor of BRCA1 n=1 Tax=Oesophagostomum dentatum TaxID=61180 RepID=A0A0B1SY38_OESDE|nr:cofactor of BRCA1 [Oesophagostomum dentatum]